MAILNILTYPNDLLRQKAKPVENVNDKVQEIIENMIETMYAAPGSGLAAIQVGIDKSIFIYDMSPVEEGQSPQILINPTIVSSEDAIVSENEGCLSIPDFRADVKRSSYVKVEALDREGNPLSIEGDKYLAIVLQHEIDHLNGILFIDHLSPLKRGMYKNRVKKQMSKSEKKV